MPLVSYEASEVTKTEGENGRGALQGEPTCHALRGALACSSLGSRWAYLLPGRKGAKAVLWARVLDDGDAGSRLRHEGQPSALWPVLLYHWTWHHVLHMSHVTGSHQDRPDTPTSASCWQCLSSSWGGSQALWRAPAFHAPQPWIPVNLLPALVDK